MSERPEWFNDGMLALVLWAGLGLPALLLAVC